MRIIGIGFWVFCAVAGLGFRAHAQFSSPMYSNATVPVSTAYKIDSKIDDGYPTSGNVQAVYVNGDDYTPQQAPNTPTDSAGSCYNTNNNTYSTAYHQGNGGNCALSFKMQGGD